MSSRLTGACGVGLANAAARLQKRTSLQNELSDILSKYEHCANNVREAGDEKIKSERDINRYEMDIAKLQRSLEQLGQGGDTAAQLRQLSGEADARVADLRRVQTESQAVQRERGPREAEHRRLKEEYARLENDREQRLRRLSRTNRKLYELLEWIRGPGAQQMRGRVYDPPCLDIAPVSELAAIMLERVIPKATMCAIAVEVRN